MPPETHYAKSGEINCEMKPGTKTRSSGPLPTTW